MASVFVSYSHRDEEFRNELEVHLAMLKRQGLIDVWHDRRITAGKAIDPEISSHLESASLVLLLVSLVVAIVAAIRAGRRAGRG